MGMHIGLIGIKASVTQFREAFTRTWPKFEVIASADSFPDEDAMKAWKESHERFVSAADWTKESPGSEVYFILPRWSLGDDGRSVLCLCDGRACIATLKC
jgi:hypothetical protein